MPDSFKSEAFGADHYKPVKHFPHLKTVYSNLFYVCNSCNSRKGSYWPTALDREKGTIPNPCDHIMIRHLRYRGEQVESRSDGGEFTLKLLDLNNPSVVQVRSSINHAIELAAGRADECRRVIEALKKGIRSGKLDPATVKPDIDRMNAEAQKLDRTLAHLLGKT